MNNKSNKNPIHTASTITFSSLLTIVFITLKLLGVIEWHWVWVLSPMWISIALEFLLLLILFVVYLTIDGVKALKQKARKKKIREQINNIRESNTTTEQDNTELTEGVDEYRNEE